MQALHSALIDELSERFPEEKLELGLPKRFSEFTFFGGTKTAMKANVTLGDAFGVVALGFGDGQKDSEQKAIFENMLQRAEKEFQRRGITPGFGKLEIAKSPKDVATVSVQIGYPIQITRKGTVLVFDLSVGVR